MRIVTASSIATLNYCTTRVRFVLWVNVVEPELEVPVTVRVKLPVDVPLLLPPHAVITAAMDSRLKTAIP